MTIPFGRQDEDIHALMLRFMGGFAHVQSYIDEYVARIFLDNRIPHSASFFWDSAVSRIRDSERPRLVQQIAADLSSDADLSCFNSVYADVKRVRDQAAHAARVEAVSDDELRITKTILASASKPPVQPTTLTRRQLFEAIRSCAWLEAQVQYILYSSDLVQKMIFGQHRAEVEVVKPTRLPKDWDGTVFRHQTSS